MRRTILAAAIAICAIPSHAQDYRNPYGYGPVIPYGGPGWGGPQYGGGYYRQFQDNQWLSAPYPRSGWSPYYPGAQRQQQYPQSYGYPGRPYLPGWRY